MRRRTGYVAWLIIIAAVVVLFLAWQYFSFRLARRTLPAGMTIAGLPVEGMTRAQALNALEVAFATPLQVAYQEQSLSLTPDSVELRYDDAATAANLDGVLSAQTGLDGFMTYVLRHQPEPMDIPAAVSYSEKRLDGFLTRAANQYDRPPQESAPLPDGLTFRPAQPGFELDIEASRSQLAAALVSAIRQPVALIVRTEAATALGLDALGQSLQPRLADHQGLIAGIFIKNLQTGDELKVNADVAFTGLRVLKIAILEETYRLLELPLDIETADWVSDTMGVTDSDPKANLLLRDVIGGGDGYQGAENLSASMHYLGLINTFMATPYGENTIPPTVVTPANSRTDISTAPDARIQTTPLDVGLLLEMIYQCREGGGALMVAYPGDLTVDECSQMIEWMSANRTDSLIEAGVPVGTTVAHKQGFTGDTHADAALVFSPGGDFVLVAFLHRPQWLPWEESAPLITEITTATYNYFNPAP